MSFGATEAGEALRQQALLASLATGEPAPGLGLREHGARAARGLDAYRANAGALSERALAAACPTVQAMLGESPFARLARAFAAAHPPRCGDIGEWGGELPAWIAAAPDLAEWPWLADSAALDLALHRCERAADATTDAASLALLGECEPAQIALVLLPGSAVLGSGFPIATIHAAHHGRSGDTDPFAPVREALAAARGEAVLVARHGWRARLHRLDAREHLFCAALLEGVDLAGALDRAGADFDFAAWLQRALAEAWLKGAARLAD